MKCVQSRCDYLLAAGAHIISTALAVAARELWQIHTALRVERGCADSLCSFLFLRRRAASSISLAHAHACVRELWVICEHVDLPHTHTHGLMQILSFESQFMWSCVPADERVKSIQRGRKAIWYESVITGNHNRGCSPLMWGEFNYLPLPVLGKTFWWEMDVRLQ